MTSRILRVTRTLALSALFLPAACSDDDDDVIAGPDGARVYNQVERLGNPLVSEVTLAKRNHGFHNAGAPSTDVASHAAELRAFVRTVAGRNETVANTIAAVLLPDMLIVQTDKPGNTAGWLTWALADGYGGRPLSDDVVDAGLTAIFGSLLDPDNVSAGLTTDNVDANDKPFETAFPYLAAPHTN
ncbi:MAG TPA: DUF4331 family protein [Gemmatimonadaceae bacterium]|nr:DUF4331 family protein [Gemmatimonadaceae bacterium]